MMLRRRIATQPKVAGDLQITVGSRGTTPIVGNCKFCQDQKRKQRKTRKSCVVCEQPVCNEYSSPKIPCVTREN
jgi:hypothetical protein